MGTGMAAGVVGLGIGEGEARGERGWGRANGLSAARRWLILSGEGKRVHTKIRPVKYACKWPRVAVKRT